MYHVNGLLSNLFGYFIGQFMSENKEPREYGGKMLYPP